MKIGVVSDVHGNLEALSAVLEFFNRRGVQQVLCCGDIVGYGPDPVACIELLQQAGARGVAGNHEWGVLGKTPLARFNSLAVLGINWTRAQLADKHRFYLDGLPLIFRLGPLHIVHGGPADPAEWEYVFSLDDADEQMGAFFTDICLIGHTHIPLVAERVAKQGTRIVKKDDFFIREDAKYLINVGSVGQPRDGDPRAACVIIDLNEKQVTFYRVEYDICRTQEKIRKAGLPEELAFRLAQGR